MRGVISLHPTGDRLVVLVEMNTDENAICDPIRERRAICQRDISISQASHQRCDSSRVEKTIYSSRHVPGKIVSEESSAHRTGILSRMVGCTNPHSKPTGR